MIASSDDDHEQWGRSFTKFAGGQSMQSGINRGQLFVGGRVFFVLFWLASYSQKAILKISIAKIHQNLREKFPYFSTHGSGSQLKKDFV